MMNEKIRPAFEVLRRLHDYAVAVAQEEGVPLQDLNWLLIMEGITNIALSGADKEAFLETLQQVVESTWRHAER
jgi:hypothetical protein